MPCQRRNSILIFLAIKASLRWRRRQKRGSCSLVVAAAAAAAGICKFVVDNFVVSVDRERKGKERKGRAAATV